ncbi:MAG: Vitamin B12-binding protein precursor [Lentisphaerae bacterium ADurb.BinA184]|nr:MAG: Vitamin B12-binding protein precursor [Lentisphaerae bacterium ADurb.BinA184]
MKRTLILTAAVLAIFTLSFAVRRLVGQPGAPATRPAGPAVPRRIVSLAPSVTEIVYALEMEPSLVGVTRYCDYPPAARGKPKVGGYFDPSFEAVAALDPDLIILLSVHDQPRRWFEGQGRRTLTVNHQSIEGILDSIRLIAEAGGVPERGAAVLADLRARMTAIARTVDGLPRPRVLLAAGRTAGRGELGEVYIAGRSGFYTELIRLAGGVNAYTGSLPFPEVSSEGILSLDPDVVIDVVGDMEAEGADAARIAADWQTIPQLRALRNGRLHVITDEYVVIPGPRFILTLERLARVLHPEAEWE